METERVAALIADLDDPDKPTLRAAVDALIDLAATAPQIRDVLHHRLGAAGHRNYWPVAYILGHLPSPSGATLRNLIDTLDHREPDIRWACALLLEKIAQSEPAVIGLLIELCRYGTANQKRMALYCLRDLKLSDPESLNAMLGALSDADTTVRVAAVISLRMRADGSDLVRDGLLSSYLNDAAIEVRNAAAVTLAQSGSPSEAFLTSLRRALCSEDRQARKAAAMALALIEKK